MPIVNGDVISVKYVCSSKPANQNLSMAINVMHYSAFGTVGTGATDQQIADGFSTIMGPIYKGMINQSSKYEGVLMQKVNPLPPSVTTKSVTGAGVGIQLGEGLPFPVCGAITKLTGFAGRKFRGRVYVPFPTESDNTALTQPTQAYLDQLQALGAALIASRTFGLLADTTSFISVLFHPKPTPSTTAITGIQTRLYWTNQRRRNNAFRSDNVPLP